VAFSHDGTYLAGASMDGTARVWIADSAVHAITIVRRFLLLNS
jgi:WD40 repeat protein